MPDYDYPVYSYPANSGDDGNPTVRSSTYLDFTAKNVASARAMAETKFKTITPPRRITDAYFVYTSTDYNPSAGVALELFKKLRMFGQAEAILIRYTDSTGSPSRSFFRGGRKSRRGGRKYRNKTSKRRRSNKKTNKKY